MKKNAQERLEKLLEYCNDEMDRLQKIRQSTTSEYENVRAIGGIEAMDRIAKKVSVILG